MPSPARRDGEEGWHLWGDAALLFVNVAFVVVAIAAAAVLIAGLGWVYSSLGGFGE